MRFLNTLRDAKHPKAKNTKEIDSTELNEDQKIKIMSLSGVKQYPMRVKCATLGWHTLISAMDEKKEEINTEVMD